MPVEEATDKPRSQHKCMSRMWVVGVNVMYQVTVWGWWGGGWQEGVSSWQVRGVQEAVGEWGSVMRGVRHKPSEEGEMKRWCRKNARRGGQYRNRRTGEARRWRERGVGGTVEWRRCYGPLGGWCGVGGVNAAGEKEQQWQQAGTAQQVVQRTWCAEQRVKARKVRLRDAQYRR